MKYKVFLPSLIISLVLVLTTGCSYIEDTKRTVNGPWLEDNLADGSSKGTVDNGEFSDAGWKPGLNGSISYQLPSMAQGVVTVNVVGLNRTKPDTYLLAMYEKGYMDYYDPYVVHNPYLVQVKMKHFEDAPQSPFDLAWRIKNFPADTTPENLYVENAPSDVPVYDKIANSDYVPVYPTEKYQIKVEWKNGIAKLFINDELLAEHTYRPLVFNPRQLILVLGNVNPTEEFSLPEITYTDVMVSFPE